MMMQTQQAPATPAPPAPVRGPVDAEALARQIQGAVDQALTQAGVGEGQRAQTAREGLRGTIDQIRAEIEAARAQGVERIVVQPRFDNTIPPQAVDISVSFFVMVAFIIVGLPLARAFARRMDRKGASTTPSDIAPRLDRIEQAIEAIAIEVERVSEGQRYTTKAISDLRGLPAANPVGGWSGAGAREGERAPVSAEPTRRP